jgi:hypothetical protein
LTLLCALCAPAFAEIDPYYSGTVDSVTGEAIEGAGTSSATRIRITNNMYYDREARSFIYPTGVSTYEVRATVADGMVVTDPVEITADEGVELTLTRNSTVLEESDLSHIADVGRYSVSVRVIDSSVTLFSFTIVGASTNLPGGYTMPDGFYIIDATVNEEPADFDRNFIGMEQEGLYDVEYVCPDTAIHYHLMTNIDRTPPQVTLDGKLDKNGRFHSAVQVGGLQAGDSVVMTRDGTAVDFPADGRLTEAGVYQMQFYDAAGNAVAAQFTILVYLDLNSLLFFALVCVSLAGVLAYILVKRKKLKVA